MDVIQGFSKLSANEKLNVLLEVGVINKTDLSTLLSFRHPDKKIQEVFQKFTENVVSSYHLPFSIAPNFRINEKIVHVPMVVEESSVVAAASWSARFWSDKGGFKTRVISDTKIGQIHFKWSGKIQTILENKAILENSLLAAVESIAEKMIARGGGIRGFEWLDLSSDIPELFQCRVSFGTADSMGANFINSCLESMAKELIQQLVKLDLSVPQADIIMAILSNYTPDCLVECTVESDLNVFSEIKEVDDPRKFAENFMLAVEIAQKDPYRAVTHNKGIFNGMDGVILATANDFRAFEAGGHAYASHDGQYRSLSSGKIDANTFSYTIKVPVAVGTVGGLTSTHPLARLSFSILGKPSGPELMQIIAAAGMANNFAAIKALTTIGIQSGHMKMHLSKILMQLSATVEETESATQYFSDKTVTHREVADYIENKRHKLK